MKCCSAGSAEQVEPCNYSTSFWQFVGKHRLSWSALRDHSRSGFAGISLVGWREEGNRPFEEVGARLGDIGDHSSETMLIRWRPRKLH
jgi:hypothetical protein